MQTLRTSTDSVIKQLFDTPQQRRHVRSRGADIGAVGDSWYACEMAAKPHAPTRKRRGGISPDAVIALVEALPEVQCRPSGKWSGIKVRGKGFGYLSEQEEVLLLKASLVERAALLGSDPKTFLPSYESGESGWVEIVLRRVDPDELAELVTEAWRLTAPKTLVTAFDNR